MVTVRIPDEYSHILRDSRKYIGMMGLSVGKSDFYNKEIMAAYCDFMQKHFVYGVFVIADYPKKYNIMALDGIHETFAERRARIAGDDLRNGLEKVTRDYPFVKVARWKDFMNQYYLDNLRVLQKADELGFQQICNEFVMNFLLNDANLARWSKSGEPPIAQARNYLIDELALLGSAPFSFPLPVCEIYPGRNIAQEQLHERKFDFCKDLHVKDDRVFMEVYSEK